MKLLNKIFDIKDKDPGLNSISRVFIVFTLISIVSFFLITSLYLSNRFQDTLSDIKLNIRESELKSLALNLEQYIKQRAQILKDLSQENTTNLNSIVILGEKVSIKKLNIQEAEQIPFNNKSYFCSLNKEQDQKNFKIIVPITKDFSMVGAISASFALDYENIFGIYNPLNISYSLRTPEIEINANNYDSFQGQEYKKYMASLGLLLSHKVNDKFSNSKSQKLFIDLFLSVLIGSILSNLALFILGRNMLIEPHLKLAKNQDLLEQKTQELKASNEELDRFAYIISHDLKEPIRGMSLYADLVAKQEKVSDTSAERLQTISKLGQKSTQMLSEILEHSKIGKTDLAYTEVDINKVVEDVLTVLKVFIEENRANVVITRKLPKIKCDSVRCAEVFKNLITNAIKYNNKDSKEVEIGYYREEDSQVVNFYIKDNGNGIEEKYFKNIFEIFRRVDSDKEGTGVGLAIVKKIIDTHKGQISIESTPNKGSSFKFNFGDNSLL